jgi:hypothetical protein
LLVAVGRIKGLFGHGAETGIEHPINGVAHGVGGQDFRDGTLGTLLKL